MITVHYLVQITPNALLGHSCDKIDRSMMIKLDFLRPTVRFGSVRFNKTVVLRFFVKFGGCALAGWIKLM